MLKKTIKYIIHHTYRPFLVKFLQHDRSYTFEGIKVTVPAGIFHPGFYFSTKLLINYLKRLETQEKKILELGCGTGLISIWCAQKGAIVTASDINQKAVEITAVNAKANNVSLEVVCSDLFDHLPKDHFDLIIINPPYYPKNASNDAEKAWYCGNDFQYFQKLFFQIKPHIKKGTTVYMILSDDCELNTIFNMAAQEELLLKQVYQKRYLTEKNFIYQIVQK